jgi:hypothetical protein
MHILGEYSTNNGHGIFGGNSSRALWAQSVAGANAEYPDGDWATRSRIWRNQIPNRRENTHTAQMQIGALMMQARRNLKESGVKLE